jgi:UDP-3-O-[3-hydroxymyristoyl] glucosamine N-acyltransferase
VEKISIEEILISIDQSAKVQGRRERYVTEISPIDHATRNSITFCSNKTAAAQQMIKTSGAGVVIAFNRLDLDEADVGDKTLILVTNPRLAFIRMMQKFVRQDVVSGISPTTIIEEGAKIDPGVNIGPHCFIGKCKIGAGTVIYGHNYIYANTEIGRNVIIHPGAVIGAEGLGFERTPEEKLEKLPQIGGVMIGDDVEIGANTTVMRGALSNTIIGQGTKIGNLCYIGHTDIIGKHCLIVNQCTIGGSTHIGDGTQISLGACIRNKIKVGRNVMVGMGSVVIQDVSDGKTVVGVPAKEIEKNKASRQIPAVS